MFTLLNGGGNILSPTRSLPPLSIRRRVLGALRGAPRQGSVTIPRRRRILAFVRETGRLGGS